MAGQYLPGAADRREMALRCLCAGYRPRPFKLTVGFMFNHMAENGMPDLRAEGAPLKSAEDDLRSVLEVHGVCWCCRLLARATGIG